MAEDNKLATFGIAAGRAPFFRFWASASGFWKGRSAGTSWALTAGLAGVALAQIGVQYRLNYWNRDFFNALEGRDAAGLWAQALVFVPLACLSISLSVASVWGRMTTQRKWREWLTKHLLALWLQGDGYRRLRFVTGEYQNAEYRISYDARIATDAPVDMALGLFAAALTAVIFIDVLWAVGGSLTITVSGTEVTIPGYLVLGVCLYSFVFTTAMVAIGRRLPVIIQHENQAEAEMLAAASRIRESGEQGASAASELTERNPVWQALREVLARWRQLCWQLMQTTAVSQTDLLLAPVFAWLLCTPKYLAGTMTLGGLTQASAAFVTVQLAFNWLVDNYQRLSDWRAAINRVATLLLALDQVADAEAAPVALPSEEKQANNKG
jgi:vitamin B12/bleomycin/antimicrobial peptide transport system ATP-binding/permease protein